MTAARDHHSETQAINELAAALHLVHSGCTPLCAIAPPLGHEDAARTLFGLGWRPPWWFHNADGSYNNRPPILFDPTTGQAR